MVYIIRYSEIGTKGKNRKDFEKKLVQNIKMYFKNNNLEYDIAQRIHGRILVYCNEKNTVNFKKIFGISSYSKAIETKADLEEIKEKLLQVLKNKKFNSFRISVNRLDKEFKLNSLELEKIFGEFVVDNFNKKVSLKEFDIEIGIEFYQNKAFIFTEKIRCFSGLPVGSEGSIYSLIDDNYSILASVLMMKRGCSVIPVGFQQSDISGLQEFMPLKKELRIIKGFDELDEKISKVIVSGQTLENYKEIEFPFLVLRPLIAFDEKEITKLEERYK